MRRFWQHPSGLAVIGVMNGTSYTGDARYLYRGPTEWKVVPHSFRNSRERRANCGRLRITAIGFQQGRLRAESRSLEAAQSPRT